ncbi:MAG: hypothetical protein LDL39_09845 [Magnetospirillum sp.]|nr:hypothetical protein [Magnetospirillum sp.]
MAGWGWLAGGIIAALGCFSASANAEQRDAVGEYGLIGEPDAASTISLRADGRYKLHMMMGTVDEQDEGNWSVVGSEIRLGSTAPTRDPQYTLVKSYKTDFPGVMLEFEGAGGKAPYYTTARLHTSAGVIQANEGGPNYKRSKTARTPVEKISLQPIGILRRYPISEFKITDPSHNHFVFQAEIGNYGYVAMNNSQVQIGANGILVRLPAAPNGLTYLRTHTSPAARPLPSQQSAANGSPFVQPVEDKLNPCNPECTYRKVDVALQQEIREKEYPLVQAFAKADPKLAHAVEGVRSAEVSAVVTGAPYGLPIRYSVTVRGPEKLVSATVKTVRADGKVSFLLACIVPPGGPAPASCRQ